MIKVWFRGEGGPLSDHFHSKEFECNCEKCFVQIVDTDLIERLEKLRAVVKEPLFVTSGFRCYYYNRSLRLSSPRSRHLKGMAADVVTKKMPLPLLAEEAKRIFGRVGLASNFVHVDNDGGPAFWTY